MKATGIVRRIDDLGRVVIPKEIRRTMRIREGDPLEIYTDRDGEVIFKKYSPMGELAAFAVSMCETMNKTTGCVCAICDRDMVIAAAGGAKREILDKRVSEQTEKIMEGRVIVQPAEDKPIYLCRDSDKCRVLLAAPILSEGDVAGCVFFLEGEGKMSVGESEYKLAQTVAAFLGKQMES